MKTAREIRTEIANSFDIPVEKVRCSRCARWAYNNGGILTSVCSSKICATCQIDFLPKVWYHLTMERK